MPRRSAWSTRSSTSVRKTRRLRRRRDFARQNCFAAPHRQIPPVAFCLCRRIGRKFRFRAPLVAWQSRNACAISLATARTNAENHGIVTVSGPRPISEFLIVGCQHGWLYGVGYGRGGFEKAVIRTACIAWGLFWYGICSI